MEEWELRARGLWGDEEKLGVLGEQAWSGLLLDDVWRSQGTIRGKRPRK